MGTILSCGKALVNGAFAACEILIEDGRIAAIAPSIPREGHQLVELGQELTLLPGLIDTHIHGYGGDDTMDCDPEALRAISCRLPEAGVTSWCPTTMTASHQDVLRALTAVGQAASKPTGGAKIAGAFAEGPFISEEHRGAQPLEAISPIDFGFMEEMISASQNTLRKVIIAPEIPQAPQACAWLAQRNVVPSLGHSSATYDETAACIEQGASVAVHTFNGMRGFHHREPGLTGAVMLRKELYAELILDGIHVNPKSAQVLLQCRGSEGIVLISDCMRAGGMADGEYMLGDTKTFVKNGVARTGEGALAGSTLKLIDGVRNAVELLGLPLEKAVAMASENPARELGCFDKVGSIDCRKAADLIAIDRDYKVRFAMVDGKVVMG